MKGELQRLDSRIALPAIVAQAGLQAGKRFIEFFAATIRNKNTRAAYAQAVGQFFRWCEERGLSLETLEPIAVAAYIEQLTEARAPETVKQHLAAIRTLFDWLVTGHVMKTNPATSVKGPRLVIERGKTPYLTTDDARTLLESIAVTKEVGDTKVPILSGLRDRALISVMTFTFARVSAVLGMKVEDYYANGKKWRVRLHEKGGKFHEVPVHHKAEEYLDAYLEAAGIAHDRKGPLFRSVNRRTNRLTELPLRRENALQMVKKRARAAGLTDKLCNHSFRATGITAYMANGGDIEKAKKMAAHASTKTTELYNRSGEELTLDEVERIAI